MGIAPRALLGFQKASGGAREADPAGMEGSAAMVEKSDIFADDYWKEQWKTVVAKERTIDGDDASVLTMAVQLARRWGPKFCADCEPKAGKLLGLVDAAYKILSARREQMLADKKSTSATSRDRLSRRGGEAATLRVLEILEDIRDGLVELSRDNGRR